jgi:hypothetical protein
MTKEGRGGVLTQRHQACQHAADSMRMAQLGVYVSLKVAYGVVILAQHQLLVDTMLIQRHH